MNDDEKKQLILLGKVKPISRNQEINARYIYILSRLESYKNITNYR